jgi:hypothetical protein
VQNGGLEPTAEEVEGVEQEEEPAPPEDAAEAEEACGTADDFAGTDDGQADVEPTQDGDAEPPVRLRSARSLLRTGRPGIGVWWFSFVAALALVGDAALVEEPSSSDGKHGYRIGVLHAPVACDPTCCFDADGCWGAGSSAKHHECKCFDGPSKGAALLSRSTVAYARSSYHRSPAVDLRLPTIRVIAGQWLAARLDALLLKMIIEEARADSAACNFLLRMRQQRTAGNGLPGRAEGRAHVWKWRRARLGFDEKRRVAHVSGVVAIGGGYVGLWPIHNCSARLTACARCV